VKPPLVSVIVPIYNVRPWLSEALESLDRQECRDELEVILIDDGSTDGSDAVARNHAATSARTQYVRQDNAGVGAARNHGLRLATGDYLAFLDSDDIFAPGGLDALTRAARHHNPDMVVGDAQGLPPSKTSPWWRREVVLEERVISSLAESPFLAGTPSAWGKLYRRSLVEARHQTFGEGTAFEDMLFTLPLMLCSQRIAVIPDLVYLYRVRRDDSSIMNMQPRREKIFQHLRMIEQLAATAADADPGARRAIQGWIPYEQRHYSWLAAHSLDDEQWCDYVKRMSVLLREIPVELAAEAVTDLQSGVRTLCFYEDNPAAARTAKHSGPLLVRSGAVYAAHPKFDRYRAVLQVRPFTAHFAWARADDKTKDAVLIGGSCDAKGFTPIVGEPRPDLLLEIGETLVRRPIVVTKADEECFHWACSVPLDRLSPGSHGIRLIAREGYNETQLAAIGRIDESGAIQCSSHTAQLVAGRTEPLLKVDVASNGEQQPPHQVAQHRVRATHSVAGFRTWLPRNKSASEPLVSVIVPVYNVQRWLDEALESLEHQACRADMQVVIVNDGSTDRSSRIAKRYARRALRTTYVRQANAGLGAARNHGMRLATGQYLCFLDSDDMFAPGGVDHLLAAATQHDADIVVGDFRGIPTPINHRWRREVVVGPRLISSLGEAPDLALGPAVWAKLFRRDFVESSGLTFTEGTDFEDVLFTLPLLMMSLRTALTPEVTYLYRVRDDGTSIMQSRYRPEKTFEHLAVVERIMQMSKPFPSADRHAVARWVALVEMSEAREAVRTLDDAQWSEFVRRLVPVFTAMPREVREAAATSLGAGLRLHGLVTGDTDLVRTPRYAGPLRVRAGLVYGDHPTAPRYSDLLRARVFVVDFVWLKADEHYPDVVVVGGRCDLPGLAPAVGEQRDDLLLEVGDTLIRRPITVTQAKGNRFHWTCQLPHPRVPDGKHRLRLVAREGGAEAVVQPGRIGNTTPVHFGRRRCMSLRVEDLEPFMVIHTTGMSS
jgi:glycosyltransferase involved in cell wall biosynthesis